MMLAKLSSSPHKLNSKNFQLGCSLGSGSHCGESLKAIVDWLNQTGFEDGLIDLSDTLYRYNYMIQGMGGKEAHERTIREGQEWRESNESILAQLSMPYRIVHWDHWLKDPRFSSYEQAFAVAFESDRFFRNAVTTDIRIFYQRKYGQNLEVRSPQDVYLSQCFYIEELAAHSILFEDYPCAQVYPGRQLECFKSVRSGEVKNVPTGLLNASYAKLYIQNDNAPALNIRHDIASVPRNSALE